MRNINSLGSLERWVHRRPSFLKWASVLAPKTQEVSTAIAQKQNRLNLENNQEFDESEENISEILEDEMEILGKNKEINNLDELNEIDKKLDSQDDLNLQDVEDLIEDEEKILDKSEDQDEETDQEELEDEEETADDEDLEVESDKEIENTEEEDIKNVGWDIDETEFDEDYDVNEYLNQDEKDILGNIKPVNADEINTDEEDTDYQFEDEFDDEKIKDSTKNKKEILGNIKFIDISR
ncbi:acidic leucine-rich nuclear phosphoprotein 32 family member B-like [Octopus sinensis]|uniref:Acidic leucine-rich nuclear phosphoprotein 32 family member B-like n=1 Tax=Octopus sinensis TaxID=2607531 RepID=A0A6P7U3F1_9MOLL|nr:acidic leucine-rich nuclear phosphoprotein 32 family member B-like [Octopus sinensis]